MTIFLNFNFLFFILCFPYFILFSYPYFLLLLFFPFFSHPHTYPYFLFLYFLISSFFLPLPPHMGPYFFFFFISSFCLFSYHFTPPNVPHRAELFLPLSFSIFFLPFSLFSCQFVCKFLSLYPIKAHKFSWCFVDQNFTFKMYFSDHIRHK